MKSIENIGKTWKVSFDILPTGENRNAAWTSVFRISQKESDLHQSRIDLWTGGPFTDSPLRP